MPDGARWKAKRLLSANTGVPKRPGVYVIGHAESYRGLELKRTYVYVGMSETSLHRRLNEHMPDKEDNPGLQAYVKDNLDGATCWYAVTSAEEARNIESDLIREFQPEFNTVGLGLSIRRENKDA